MTPLASSLHEAVAALNDGAEFYERAAQKVDSVALADLFTRMGRLKRSIAGQINAELVQGGETPARSGSLFGAIRRRYGELLASINEEDGATFIDRLE